MPYYTVDNNTPIFIALNRDLTSSKNNYSGENQRNLAPLTTPFNFAAMIWFWLKPL